MTETTILIVLCLSLAVIIIYLLINLNRFKANLKKANQENHNKEDTSELEAVISERVNQIRIQYQEEKQEILNQNQNEINKKVQEINTELLAKNEFQIEKEKLRLQQQFQDQERDFNIKVLEIQSNLEKREVQLKTEADNNYTIKNDLEQKQKDLEKKQDELEKNRQKLLDKEKGLDADFEQRISSIASLSKSEAKTIVLEGAEKEMGEELLQWQQKFLSNFEEEANNRAKEIATLAIQRCSSEVANELTITSVKIENDIDKGKLIGKQGRNIQWLEKTLGVELIIDDTPNVITLSGFSSVRRNIAKKTIEKLLEDGRVHPASIEEMHEKAKGEIAQEIADAGQWAVNELGIYDFPAKLIRTLGRLKFRTGYGQNVLRHSVEMAKLAGLLADGLNAEFPSQKPIDRMICVKGALLHDIGKAIDEEMSPKGNHIEIGEKICDMFDLGWKVKKCISSHHTTGGDKQSYYDEQTGEVCLEAAIVDACDTLSGARPGARKETAEAYFQRMEALENVANKIPGVSKSWIMRGAKELWVFFNADELSPSQVHRATRKLAREINNTIKTPQEIKVIGFREDRIVEYTR
jgi:ribonucrease Y